MVRQPDATMQPTPQDNQLMPKRRVLSFEPQLRLEWRGQDGQSETKQPDHSASLGDSITSSTQIRFSVHKHIQSKQSPQPGGLRISEEWACNRWRGLGKLYARQASYKFIDQPVPEHCDHILLNTIVFATAAVMHIWGVNP
jgi:hypothetical protein